MRLLNPELKVEEGPVVGVIVKEVDIHRRLAGLIQCTVSSGTVAIVPYVAEDVCRAPSGSSRLFKGDEVKFIFVTIPGTNYSRAS